MYNVMVLTVNGAGFVSSRVWLATIGELTEAALAEIAEVFDFEIDEDNPNCADAFVKMGNRAPEVVVIEPVPAA